MKRLRQKVMFKKLRLWIDPIKRPGPEAMAVDEWLLESAEMPVLRIYGWAGDWASLGYFGEIAVARSLFSGINLVRRRTGGGMVDHRADWTYSLIVPIHEPLASSRGAESYRSIHAALEETLTAVGIPARMCVGDTQTGAAMCFQNPVDYDLLTSDGAKLAGAGQKRTRQGMLHQGSVAVACKNEAESRQRGQELANRLAREWENVSYNPPEAEIARRAATRYARSDWTKRR